MLPKVAVAVFLALLGTVAAAQTPRVPPVDSRGCDATLPCPPDWRAVVGDFLDGNFVGSAVDPVTGARRPQYFGVSEDEKWRAPEGSPIHSSRIQPTSIRPTPVHPTPIHPTARFGLEQSPLMFGNSAVPQNGVMPFSAQDSWEALFGPAFEPNAGPPWGPSSPDAAGYGVAKPRYSMDGGFNPISAEELAILTKRPAGLQSSGPRPEPKIETPPSLFTLSEAVRAQRAKAAAEEKKAEEEKRRPKR